MTILDHPSSSTRTRRSRDASGERIAFLFGRASPATRIDDERGRDLWPAEAAHRINNLAQLAAAASRVRRREGDPATSAAVWRDMEKLARAYGTLSTLEGTVAFLPIRGLLEQVATGIVSVFGARSAGVRMNTRCEELFLGWNERRALILVASELIINALKHAFPEGGPGTIEVSFGLSAGGAKLVVADDGVGAAASTGTGQGAGLLDRLVSLLSGTLTRTRTEGRFRVCVTIPVGGPVFALGR